MSAMHEVSEEFCLDATKLHWFVNQEFAQLGKILKVHEQ